MLGTGIFGLEPLEKRLLLSATLGADLADAWTAEPTPIAAILEEAVPEGPQAALPDHPPALAGSEDHVVAEFGGEAHVLLQACEGGMSQDHAQVGFDHMADGFDSLSGVVANGDLG